MSEESIFKPIPYHLTREGILEDVDRWVATCNNLNWRKEYLIARDDFESVPWWRFIKKHLARKRYEAFEGRYQETLFKEWNKHDEESKRRSA